MVALGFVFAVLMARPCPFYILDEVEAALDDVNLGRLITLFQQLREKSQLLIITHQKRTMEVADALYGVTVGDDSVSRVISLRLDEATAMASRRGRPAARTSESSTAPAADDLGVLATGEA